MTVVFDAPPPVASLAGRSPSERSWPLPPAYLAGIGTMIVAFGHLETFEKRLAFRISGSTEHFARHALGSMRASDVRTLISKTISNAPHELAQYSTEIISLIAAANAINSERNDIVHKAWFVVDGRIVVSDELTAKIKDTSRTREIKIERIYEIADAATIVAFNVAAYLGAPSDLASQVAQARQKWPLPDWLTGVPRAQT